MPMLRRRIDGTHDAVVGVEAAMLMAPSVAFMALAFLLIAAVAGTICAARRLIHT